MGTVLKITVWFVVISAKILTTRASVDSSTDTALKFSQCLIEKMSESQFFSFEDRDSMIGVADVLATAMRSMERATRGPFSLKILLTAFVTSLADVIVLEDFSRNIFRKGVYSTALEQCSISTTGYADVEFIKESLRILSSLEGSKVEFIHKEGTLAEAKIYDADRNPQPPYVFNPFAAIPSPVQVPFIPVDFDQSPKTIFGIPDGPRDASSFSATSHSDTNSRFSGSSETDVRLPLFSVSSSNSQVRSDYASAQSKPETEESEDYYPFDDSFVAPSFEFGVPHAKEGSAIVNPHDASQTGISLPLQDQPIFAVDMNFQNPIQSPGKKDLSSSTDVSSMTNDSVAASSFSETERIPEAVSLKEDTQIPSPDFFGGINVPQAKESSVRVISPIIQPQPVQNTPSQDWIAPENTKPLYHPSSTEVVPSEEVSSFAATPSASLPKTDEQEPNVQQDETLESIILNVLTNSSDFQEAFSSGISPEEALNLARNITEQSLTGYNSSIIGEALRAVSDAVAEVKEGSAENYAFALSHALVYVLKLHNLPLFVDGSKIATSVLSGLDAEMSSQKETTGEQTKTEFTSSDNAQSEEKLISFDFQEPPVAPEDTNGEIFSEALTRYLLKSDEMANFFCSGDFPQNNVQIYYNMIKLSLLGYGEEVASVAASVTSGILSKMSGESLCSSYAQTISGAIAEILDENELLEGANAESISNKIELSLKEQLTTITQTEKPENSEDGMQGQDTTDLPLETTSTRQPSFSTNADIDQKTSTLPDIYYQSSTSSIASFEDTNPTTSHESTERTYNDEAVSYLFTTSNPILILPELDTKHVYTSPFPTDVADKEIPSETDGIGSASGFSESSAKDQTMNYTSDDTTPGASDDIIDQEELASFLFTEMESVLDSLSDQELLVNTPSYDSTASEGGENPINSNHQASADETLPKEAISLRRTEPNRRGNKERGTTAPQQDAVASSTRQIEKAGNDNITSAEHEAKNISTHFQSEARILVKDEAVSNSGTQRSSVILQPSFQGPQSSSSSSAASKMLPQAPSTIFYDFDYKKDLVKALLEISTDSIAYIWSDAFDIKELCDRLNELAPILQIQPLDYCEEISVIDYLLHVLRSATTVLKGA